MHQDSNRREFLRNISMAGAALTTAAVSTNAGAAGVRSKASDDELIVVNGLDPSHLTVDVVDAQKAGGVHCWHRSTENSDVFADDYAFMARNSNKIVPAFSVRDIRAARRAGRIALLFGWQDANILQDEGRSNAPAISRLDAYYERGLRICGIAYNLANDFGGGNLDPQVGLTRNGRELVQRIHKLRIVLDVGGHTGEQTSLDALAMSSGVPAICSHTNVLAIMDNPRNTSDRVFEGIAKSGGVIGLSAFSDFHVRSRKDVAIARMAAVSLDRHLDQYDYLKRLVGVDHIGLGPDFYVNSPRGLLNVQESATPNPPPNPTLNSNGSVSSRNPESYSAGPDINVNGFDNISKLPNVSRGLAQRGWTPAEIRKVMGDNWLRVYEKVWGG